jgi:hypothetical protein
MTKSTTVESDRHADAEEDGRGPAPARSTSPKPSAISKVRLDPHVAAGLGRCLRARLERLDSEILHAKEIAQTQPFFAHWAGHLEKIRVQAATHLTEFEGPGSQ